MENAKKFLLAIVSLIIGFYVGRALLPANAASRYLIPLGGQAQPIASAPVGGTTAPQTPSVYTPPIGSTAYPTPYPTPADVAISSGIYPTPYPPPADVAISPGIYPTPYPPPADPSAQVGAVSNTSRLPSASDLRNVDWGTHLPYLILALLALAVAAKKYSDARTLCVALFVLGVIAGRYLDFGPIEWPKIAGIVILKGKLL